MKVSDEFPALFMCMLVARHKHQDDCWSKRRVAVGDQVPSNKMSRRRVSVREREPEKSEETWLLQVEEYNRSGSVRARVGLQRSPCRIECAHVLYVAGGERTTTAAAAGTGRTVTHQINTVVVGTYWREREREWRLGGWRAAVQLLVSAALLPRLAGRRENPSISLATNQIRNKSRNQYTRQQQSGRKNERYTRPSLLENKRQTILWGGNQSRQNNNDPFAERREREKSTPVKIPAVASLNSILAQSLGSLKLYRYKSILKTH